MQTKKFLHVVQDYEPSGLEFGEIIQRLHYFLAEPDSVTIHQTSVPSLDTMAIGFVTAQYALAPSSKNMVIYGNAAPRRDRHRTLEPARPRRHRRVRRRAGPGDRGCGVCGRREVGEEEGVGGARLRVAAHGLPGGAHERRA